MMRKYFWFLLLSLFVFANAIFAQANIKNNKQFCCLDNYRIPMDKNGAVIGKILFPDLTEKSEIKLVTDTAKIFTINKKGYLSLKKNVALKSCTPGFCYAITLKVKEKLIDFELVKDEFIHNKVIAHRGAWKSNNVAQNSLRSLQNAITIGCEGSEFDVWLSSDNVIILSHDSTIGGLPVEKETAEKLKNVVLSTGDKVPTLEEYLTEVKRQNKTALFLEIKSSEMSAQRTLELTDSIVTMVHRMKAQGWVQYISFNYDALKHIYELDPGAKTAYLSGDEVYKTVDEVKGDNISGIDYSSYSYRSNANLNKEAHALGLSTNVWTIDSEDELKFYLEKELDYITTNEPEKTIGYYKNKCK